LRCAQFTETLKAAKIYAAVVKPAKCAKIKNAVKFKSSAKQKNYPGFYTGIFLCLNFLILLS